MPKQILISAIFCLMTLGGFAQFYEKRQYSIIDGLPSNLTSCVEQDSRGLIWIGTWSGLCCYDGYEFLSFDNASTSDQSPLCTRVHSLKTDASNNVWLITYDHRAYCFDTQRCQYTDVSEIVSQRFGLDNVRFRNIYALENGAVWFTCYDDENHAFRVAPAKQLKAERKSPKENLAERITDEFPRLVANCGNIVKVVQDKQACEWIETGNGSVMKWQAGKNALAVAKGNEAAKARAVLDAYTSVQKPVVDWLELADDTRRFLDKQGNMWTLGSNLVKYSPKRSLLRPETPENIKKLITRQKPSKLYAQLTDSRGRKWQGYKGGGLTKDGKPCEEGLVGKDVFDIFEDSKGHIWVACYDGGFNLLDEGTGRFVSQKEMRGYPKERHEKVRHIIETRDGVIILSTAEGIVCFSSAFKKPQDIQFHSYTTSRDQGSIPGGNVMQVLEASDGKIYISTMTGGLTTIVSGHPLKDNLRFAPVEGIKKNTGIVLAFVEDDDKCLWLARENHLERYNMRTGQVSVFGRNSFGGQFTFSEALPVIDPTTGDITMGLAEGTMTFNPKQMTNSDFAPRILFSSFQYQGTQERQPILYAEELDVPSDKRNLTIYFSALDYQDNELVQYAYKIVEDSGNAENNESIPWNYVGRAHSASFNNLPCGHLRLLVKSTNADGVWTDNVAELRIYSHPTFWETPWAWLLYAVLVLCIVMVAVYIVQMRNRHRREREEMEHKLEVLLASIEAHKQEQSSASKETAEQPVAKNFTLKEVKIESEEKKLMEKLMAFLDENIGNSELKINDLADAVHMSRSVFYDRMKNITGMSPVDFLRYLRIQRSKQLLADTELSVSQIAFETGFSDPNYFSKVFKKSTGQSPLTFRKNQQK